MATRVRIITENGEMITVPGKFLTSETPPRVMTSKEQLQFFGKDYSKERPLPSKTTT
ncbi:MAG: hypothetical protein LBN34_03255 [Clostridiales Family XIII bacterium]|nr:hypothetical protein [Clostridiales Family XIII bacterium]